MARISQIRGMLLEEAILFLLRSTGYRTVDTVGSDPTLQNGSAGLEVKGRGGNHQIDAIADFIINSPFAYPQRLLLEAKCYAKKTPVKLPIVRNAVGVLKDVSEYWVPSMRASASKGRFHYQYALFSVSGYTSTAERYAYAQDIYLIPLGNSSYFKPITNQIRQIGHRDFAVSSHDNINVSISTMRRQVRSMLRESQAQINDQELANQIVERLESFSRAVRKIGSALLAMLAKRFPVFLTPEPEVDLQNLPDQKQVRIYYDDLSWYIRDRENDQTLFSFELPLALFEMYAAEGVLTASRALDLKSEMLRTIQAIHSDGDRLRVLTFELEPGWVESIRERYRAESDTNNTPDGEI